MKLLNFNIIKLLAYLITGILLSFFYTFPTQYILLISVFLLIVLFFLDQFYKTKKTVWFGVVSFTLMILIGILTVNFHNPRNYKTHYTKYLNLDSLSTDIISFKVSEKLKPSAFHDKYIGKIITINNKSVTGKFLINIAKDSTKTKLQVGDMFITSETLNSIPQPKNPYQFDYKSYLERQYIYHQIYCDHTSLFKTKNQSISIFYFAATIRETINEKLKQFNFEKDELAIINALLLGERKEIDATIYQNYINAGVVHILAVSGLHVGIVLLILNFILKPVEYLKHGKLIKTIVILLLLWSFAIIAGLSASVTRAVTMFSILAIAINWKRPTNIYNTLAISMFILLLIKPLYIFDVGFQLSYVAVFAIVWIQPLLYNLWKPRLKLVDFFWNIFTVTTAAQIGVLPISLYYFHQFPGLFFISNLVIIPFLGIILSLGFIVIILAACNMLPQFIADFYGVIISFLNDFIDWVAQQEQFLIKDISFKLLLLFPIYLLLIAVIRFCKTVNYPRLVFVLISILILQVSLIFIKYDSSSEEIVIFNKSRHTVIGKEFNKQLTIYHNLDSLKVVEDNSIKNYKVARFIKSINEDSIKDFYVIKNKTLFVIDSLSAYNVKTVKPDYILLRNSPKVNLKRLIDSLNPKLIIADASNFKSYVARWKTTCKKEKLPFHSTYEKGAYIFK